MGRIAIDTKEVRSLGRVLEATAQDLNRTTRRVRDRHQATQLNTARDPSVNQIQPGVNGVGYQLDRAAREYNRHAETATRTAREMEAADQLDLKPSLGPAGTKQSGWFPLPGLGNLPYIPIISGPWNQIPGNDSGGWTGFFGDGLQAGTAALDRARNGLNRFTGTVTNVGNRFIGGARGLLGRAGNFASDVQDKVGDTIHGVTNKVGDAWDWASGGISSAWNWGKDKLTTLIKDTWNNIWNGLTNTFHAAIEGIKALAAAAVWTVTAVAAVGWTVVRLHIVKFRFFNNLKRFLAVTVGRQLLEGVDWLIPFVDGDFSVPPFQTPPALTGEQTGRELPLSEAETLAASDRAYQDFEDRAFAEIALTPVTGEGDAELNRLMESLLSANPPEGAELRATLDEIAAIREIDDPAPFYEEYEVMRAYLENYDHSHTSNLDTLIHPNHLGSEDSLRYGAVVGEYLGIDPVFASLINPTGGIVGPGNFELPNDQAVRRHGYVHDAAGHLQNIYGIGPGYDYLDTSGANPSDSPLAGQIEGIAWWQDHLGPWVAP